MSTPLVNVDNGLKRKAEDSQDAVSSKKPTVTPLKSVQRKMSVQQAKAALQQCKNKVKTAEQTIKDKKKEIRALKKQLKAAKEAVKDAEMKKSRFDRESVELRKEATNDVTRIMNNVTSFSYDNLGRNSIDDMFTLYSSGECTKKDVIELVNKIGSSTRRGNVQMEALVALMEQKVAHDELVVSAIDALCSSIFDNAINSSYKIWPCIAEALPSVDGDSTKFEAALLAKAEQMKQDNQEDKAYTEHKDKCFILDLLVPTCEKLPDLHPSKANVQAAIKLALGQSLASSAAPANYSMPTEAAIASKNGFPQVSNFLMSPTDTELPLNLSKAGRMNVHRLIDDKMSYGKLKHVSEGTGRDRVLIIRKGGAPTAEQMKILQQHRQKHSELFLKMSS